MLVFPKPPGNNGYQVIQSHLYRIFHSHQVDHCIPCLFFFSTSLKNCAGTHYSNVLTWFWLKFILLALSCFLPNRNLLFLTRDPHESFLILISIMIKTVKGPKCQLHKRLRAPGLFCLRHRKSWGNLYLVYKIPGGRVLRTLSQTFLGGIQRTTKRQGAQIKTQ